MNRLQEIGSGLVKIIILACVILLSFGLAQWGTRQPIGSALILQPPPSPGPIVVHVSGAVKQPGVYSLPYGTRLQDSLIAAGGLAENANSDTLNLAANLEDGQRILVPTARPTPMPVEVRGYPTFEPASISMPVNINAADAAALEALPEIGPVTANKIIAYREANGPFQSIEDIQDVPGIGPKTFEAIKHLITVTEMP